MWRYMQTKVMNIQKTPLNPLMPNGNIRAQLIKMAVKVKTLHLAMFR